jgi:hypothetical protein
MVSSELTETQRAVYFDNAMLLEKLKSAATATVSLIDSIGNEIGSTSYDLTAVEDCDTLLLNAWNDAASQSLQPQKCTPTS